jgi:hypothetical protein
MGQLGKDWLRFECKGDGDHVGIMWGCVMDAVTLQPC